MKLATSHGNATRCLSYIVLLFSAIAGTLRADDFEAGIEAYHESKYTEAIQAFEQSIARAENAATRHNLALSYYQNKQAAEAAWQIERAVRLDPLNKNYLYKLGAIRQQLGLYEPPVQWWHSASQALTRGTWIWITCLSFWILFACFLLPKAGGFRRPILLKLFSGAAVIALAISAAALSILYTQQASGLIVSDAPAVLHHAPASAAPEAGVARPGERAKVLDAHGDFLKIETEAQIKGWVSQSKFRAL